MKRSMLVSNALAWLLVVIAAHVFCRASEAANAYQEDAQQKLATKPDEIAPWPPAVARKEPLNALFQEYSTIFRHGNRNAASHRWATFLLDRASQMTRARLEYFMRGFCAISGSPIGRPNDYNRYRLTLPRVHNNNNNGRDDDEEYHLVTGFLHFCCWPCVCDTQDFIRIDTLNVTTRRENNNHHKDDDDDAMETHQYHFAVIGNPCQYGPQALQQPFVQPSFSGTRTTTLAQVAKEIRCVHDPRTNTTTMLEGATLSDHGYIIIGMFLDATIVTTMEQAAAVLEPFANPTPGKISTTRVPDTTSDTMMDRINHNDDSDHYHHHHHHPNLFRSTTATRVVTYQDEREWVDQCTQRAAEGYHSGMGEIFRQVATMAPIGTTVTTENWKRTLLLSNNKHHAKVDNHPIMVANHDEPHASPTGDSNASIDPATCDNASLESS